MIGNLSGYVAKALASSIDPKMAYMPAPRNNPIVDPIVLKDLTFWQKIADSIRDQKYILSIIAAIIVIGLIYLIRRQTPKKKRK
jgi:hypothetical protein